MTVRLSGVEVDVCGTIYVFLNEGDASNFAMCIGDGSKGTVDVCLKSHNPIKVCPAIDAPPVTENKIFKLNHKRLKMHNDDKSKKAPPKP